MAADGGHTNVCQLLIDRGARVDTVTRGGSTAMHLAAAGGHRQAMLTLLRNSNGSSLDVKDNNGMTPITLAINEIGESIVDIFWDICPHLKPRTCSF